MIKHNGVNLRKEREWPVAAPFLIMRYLQGYVTLIHYLPIMLSIIK